MKRRGFSPTIRTFQTMFTGLSRIEHWSSHPKQLENARGIYEAYQRHTTAVKKDDPESPELSASPLAPYIRLLGTAGRYQEIFDVYYAMDTEGRLAPDQFIFAAMFQALSSTFSNDTGNRASIGHKNAADARLLWSQMLKASKKSPGFPVDSHLITFAIIALSHGRPEDQTFAFQILRDYLGLTAPDKPPATGTVPLAPQALTAALNLCNASKNHSHCIHFFEQVRRRPEAQGGASIIDRTHMEEVLRARLALAAPGSAHLSLQVLEWMLTQEITGKNGPKIRPAISTFNLVLMACWRGADWQAATRTFELMTGLHCHDFMDGAVVRVPRQDERGPGRNLVPTAETMSCMVRTASATRDVAHTRQALRLVDHLGAEELFAMKPAQDSNKAAKNRAFHVSKLAVAVTEAVKVVLAANKGKMGRDEDARWIGLADQAEEVLTKIPRQEFIPTSSEVSYGQAKEDSSQYTDYERALRR